MVDLARHRHRYSGVADFRPSPDSQTSYLPPLDEDLPAPTLEPFLDQSRSATARTLQPLIEKWLPDFNLMGAVISRVTLIY